MKPAMCPAHRICCISTLIQSEFDGSTVAGLLDDDEPNAFLWFAMLDAYDELFCLTVCFREHSQLRFIIEISDQPIARFQAKRFNS